MRIEVKVPVLPESIAEATLVNWHKQPGQSVKRDENLIDVETDKVVLELPAPDAGVLIEIRKPDGSTVTAQEVIAVIDTEGKAAEASAPVAPTAKAPAGTTTQASPSPSPPPAEPCRDRFRDRTAGRAQDDGRAEYRCRRRFRDGPRRADHQGRCDRCRRRRSQGRQAGTRSRFVSCRST